MDEGGEDDNGTLEGDDANGALEGDDANGAFVGDAVGLAVTLDVGLAGGDAEEDVILGTEGVLEAAEEAPEDEVILAIGEDEVAFAVED